MMLVCLPTIFITDSSLSKFSISSTDASSRAMWDTGCLWSKTRNKRLTAHGLDGDSRAFPFAFETFDNALIDKTKRSLANQVADQKAMQSTY